LIDEFQDTSAHQYTLFEQLVAGWSPGDGHTLFLVGDPMQSIYRFRGAEVGLFSTVQQIGLGGISCETLTLTHNFRASPTVIDWVNTLFTQIMPYTPSQAVKTEATQGVQCAVTSDKQQEAAYVASQVQSFIQQYPTKTIAILGRTRAHLTLIVQQLKQRNIAFTATELATLEDSPLIQDLLTLATALQDEHNRIAWLALFRTPHLAMRLSDCTLCVAWAEQHNQTLFEALQQLPCEQFHPESRIVSLLPILKRFYSLRTHMPFVSLIKTLWQAMGGIAAYPDTSLETAQLFFSVLAGYTINTFRPNACAERLFAEPLRPPVQAKSRVFVMTLHKAKGLEFDGVFIPRLADRTVSDAQRLLLLQEYPSGAGVNWLMAPMRAFEKTEDALYEYLAAFQKKKFELEMARLLYVGVTRAKEAVFLSMVLGEDRNGELKSPAKNSLAALLWPHIPQPERIPIEAATPAELVTPAQAGVQSTEWPTLPPGWQLPAVVKEALDIDRPLILDEENIQWQKRGYETNAKEALSEQAAFKVFMHALTEAIKSFGIEAWLKQMQGASPQYWQQQLESFGVTESHCYTTLKIWLKELSNNKVFS
jgi:ATP-dependent exoDNAse (exonuclease V) beta subunit